MGKRGQDIISVIDQRIDSYIKESKITVRYIGQIIEILGNNRYKVSLIGYNTIYIIPKATSIPQGMITRDNTIENDILIEDVGLDSKKYPNHQKIQHNTLSGWFSCSNRCLKPKNP